MPTLTPTKEAYDPFAALEEEDKVQIETGSKTGTYPRFSPEHGFYWSGGRNTTSDYWGEEFYLSSGWKFTAKWGEITKEKERSWWSSWDRSPTHMFTIELNIYGSTSGGKHRARKFTSSLKCSTGSRYFGKRLAFGSCKSVTHAMSQVDTALSFGDVEEELLKEIYVAEDSKLIWKVDRGCSASRWNEAREPSLVPFMTIFRPWSAWDLKPVGEFLTEADTEGFISHFKQDGIGASSGGIKLDKPHPHDELLVKLWNERNTDVLLP